MELENVIDVNNVCVLKGNTKKDAILELVELIEKSGSVKRAGELKESLFHRETLMSTGIGLGIAVPHVRVEHVSEPVVAIGVNPYGIPDYESIDDQLVKIVIMIIAGKEQHKEYITLLYQIVSKLKDPDVRDGIIKAGSPEKIAAFFTGRKGA